MRLLIITILAVGALASNDELWHHWKRLYQKEYNGPEDARRRAIWEQNAEHIKHHNLRHDLGLVTYTLGLNQFTDLTFEEFKAKYLSEMPSSGDFISEGIPFKATITDIPDNVDWRESGYVSEVKDQGSCGSCWAFSTTGSMEGQYIKKYRTKVSFSEQQLVDCSTQYGNHGCHGGLMENAYRYLKDYGLEQENDYAYRAMDGRCRSESLKGIAKTTDYVCVHSGNEQQLKQMIGQEGPASVALDVEKDFMMYRKGIYKSNSCSSVRLNHGVLAIGYGSDYGHDYWIVKNSWGPRWGDQGYIRMARNEKNMCGIATMASVPHVTIAHN